MKKLHIQAIEKMALEKLPAPNAYSLPTSFGKEGPKYSLAADTSRTESKIKIFQCPNSESTHIKEGHGTWTWRV
jgi:hypothetical protein